MNNTLQSKTTQSLAKTVGPVTQSNATQSVALAHVVTPPVQNSDDNWAMMQLLELAKILGLPADKTLASLVPHAIAIMASKK